MKLKVVIVNYNSLNTIRQAIEPLYELYQQQYLTVIVVDNHGSDGVAEMLKSDFSWVTLKKMSHNLGFGHACNIGFSGSETEFTLFLNPDAIILPDAITYLVNFLEKNSQIALTAPAIFEGETLQQAGLMPIPLWNQFYNKIPIPEERLIIPHKKEFQTTWLCGAILLIRSDIFKTIDGFDEKFFLYFEETDLCKRISDLGFEIWANGMVTAEHIGGGSTKDTNTNMIYGCIAHYYYQSRYYFNKKHYGSISAFLSEIMDFYRLFKRAIKHSLQKQPDSFKAFKIRLHALFS